ncbi:MAG: TonB family protein [Elusimicrobiota bacterium]
MTKFLAYSTGLHLTIFFLIFSSFFFQRHVDVSMYYGVDFVGTIGGSAQKPSTDIKTKESKIITIPKVTKDDLQIKTKNTKAKDLVRRLVDRENPPAQVINPEGNAGAGNSGLPFGQGGGGISVSNFPYNWYLSILRDRLMSRWNEESSLSKKQVCSVMFVIEKDGSLGDLSIERSSGDGYFDHVALRSVEYSQPFPPLPEDFKENELRVHVDFKVSQ